jgi:N-acetyl-gamma-glutamyl-phosphate reductase
VEQTLKVCVFGATGYTGIELLRILANHPKVEITCATSRTYAGQDVSDAIPTLRGTRINCLRLTEHPEKEFDLAFLCLPHEGSMDLVPSLIGEGKRVIDLSGAYRLKDPELYPTFYGFKHSHPELLGESVYGLPEIYRDRIKKARLVANPGCYPTASLIGLYPLIKEKIEIEEVIIHALSGVSGAGRKTRQQFHYPEMEENFFAYSVRSHRHTPEIEGVLKELLRREIPVRFTPVVVPASRGMLATVYVRTPFGGIMDIYDEVYAKEPFIILTNEPPMTRWVLGTNFCYLYAYYDKRTSTAVIITAIDNLGKGASHQAVQNMNIMAGFEETTALMNWTPFP